MLLKTGGDIGRVLIAVPLIPDGRVYVEGPAGIVVEGVAVPVPAVPHIKIQHRLSVVQHDVLFDRIALHMQKRHIQHIEKTPVLRYGAGMGKARQKRGDGVLFLLRIGGPDFLAADPEADDQSTGFHRLLIGPEGLMSVYFLKLLVGSCGYRIPGRTGAEHLAFIVFLHGIAADGQFRIVVDQRGGDKKASGEPFKHLRFFFSFQRVRGRIFMRIGDLSFLSGKHHGIFETGDILKNSVQQVFPRFNPAFPHQSGKGTFFKIKCLRLKCHMILLPALLKRAYTPTGMSRRNGAPAVGYILYVSFRHQGELFTR